MRRRRELPSLSRISDARRGRQDRKVMDESGEALIFGRVAVSLGADGARKKFFRLSLM